MRLWVILHALSCLTFAPSLVTRNVPFEPLAKMSPRKRTDVMFEKRSLGCH